MRRRLVWSLLGVIVILLITYGALTLLPKPTADHPFFAQFQQRPLAMAHRGGKGLWPENTLYAFEQAVGLGVDVLEMDRHSTADGAMVVIRDAGMTDRVLMASFQQETVEEFRRQCPEVATSTSQDEVITMFVLSKAFLESTYSPGAEAVQVPEYRGGLRVLTPGFVGAAQGRNLQVHAWTINDVEGMKRMLALGVDGIITDYPDRLMELLGRQGLARCAAITEGRPI